ncbi:energy-coupling factor transporter transmembrane protein EcfT [Ciceribacter sp. L1K23]|uniref:energy-coupling factor transporter transmembrane component T family protein n=1 Tax=Ciceribacter sp. L1K23 TaxID=2820276 RepID=UPI001B83DEEA|nr:energy-coupling factor transporter transmembrane protein EcfT [Ciceribacter sp. L1K23]MBR0556720.1 energy-coupling factor transporter transmembrane protein EcfT [Ciceribacter sp. L1K23]
MRTLYVEGRGLLYRMPAGAKIAALMVFGVLLFLTREVPWLGLGLLLAGASYFGLGQRLRSAIAPLTFVLLTVTIVALFNLVFVSLDDALVTVLRLTALVFAAATVTATTRIGDFIAAITMAARPLESLGRVRADDIGLAVGLVIRFLPDIVSRYDALKLAHQARGLKSKPLTLLGPLIILTLRDADKVADAIDARGIRKR